MSTTLFSRADMLIREGKPFVLATLIGKEGSASRKSGRLLVEADGNFCGTIGGGALEAFAIGKACELFSGQTRFWAGPFAIEQVGKETAGTVKLAMERVEPGEDDRLFALASELERFHTPFAYGFSLTGTTTRRYLFTMGQTVYGTPTGELEETARQALLQGKGRVVGVGNERCFIDIPQRCATLLLVGGGHVNQAVANLADQVGLEVRVVETRPEFATRALFPHARSLIVGSTVGQALAQVPLTSYTYVVIASHAFSPDQMETLFSSPVPYIGVLSSHNKQRALQSRLQPKSADAQRLFCPIGLDIGSETPQEIAVSIIAEIMRESRKASGNSLRYQNRNLVVVRGAGDLATGVIIRLHNAGFSVVALEIDKPTVIRCTVSLAQAMFDKRTTVEGVTAVRCEDTRDVFPVLSEGHVPILPDPAGRSIGQLRPLCVVDAILAKRNTGTRIDDAPLVIALGPGFTAGKDCHVAIETKRGHSLGRIITDGSPLPDSGIPGVIAGFGAERVLRSPGEGIFSSSCKIGDLVRKGDCVAHVGSQPILATIDGMVRGLLNNGLPVTKGFKVADIDPRGADAQWKTCSDKAKAIAGSVLEVLDRFERTR